MVGTDHRAYYPALFGLFSVVTLAVVTLAADVLIGQQGGMAPRATAWYDKTSPSFADAIAWSDDTAGCSRELLGRPGASTNR